MRVRCTKLAIEDLEAVYSYTLERYDEIAARAFLGTLQEAIEDLALFPARGREERVRGTRELVLPAAPFVVAYRVAAEEVHVLAIIHTGRLWPMRF